MVSALPLNNQSDICVSDIMIGAVSFGNSELEAELRKHIDIIIAMNNGCNLLIDYLTGSLNLIEHAMMYTRGMIDISISQRRSLSTNTYSAKNKSDSHAQRVSEGRQCSWGDTSSYQQFRRDDQQSSRATSQSDSYARGETWTNSWNLGQTWASGYSYINDWSYSTSEGDGRGEHDSVTRSYGASFSKTNLAVDEPFDISVPSFNMVSAIADVINGVIDFVAGIDIDVDWTGIITGSPGGKVKFDFVNTFPYQDLRDVTEGDQIDNGFDNPGPSPGLFQISGYPSLNCCCDNRDDFPDCPDGEEDCQWDGGYTLLHSYGRGYNVSYSLSILVPFIGSSMKVNWSDGEQFNQRHVVSKMCSNAVGQGETSNFYEQSDYAETYGRGRTHDENHARNDAHVISRARRDSYSDTTAGSAATGDSKSTSESGSDQKSHNEASNTGTGTRHSASLSTSITTGRGSSESKAESVKWSQVFKQLNQLYMTIYSEIQEHRRLDTQSLIPAMGMIESCAFAVPGDPILNSKVRSQNTFNLMKQ